MPAAVFKAYYSSEIGLLEVTGTATGITGVYFIETCNATPTGQLPAVVAAGVAQLDEYFKRQRQTFDLPLELPGTAFQQQVWRQLLTIPYGQTASYLEIAQAIGNPQAVRAVGAANGRNPISIIVPCHRVIGANGQLTGYGGGLWRKEWLLAHEKRQQPAQMSLF